MGTMTKQKFYVVWKGRQTGIFTSWQECAAAVKGYPGAQYKAFDSLQAAEAAWSGPYSDHMRKQARSPKQLSRNQRPILPSVSVDAACDGSPGWLEYRGVDTETGRRTFHAGPYRDGTNNVGEFLAIVAGLCWLERNSRQMPVYSDSVIAIGWVRAGKCRTSLAHTGHNEELFALIAQAEAWLAKHVIADAQKKSFSVLKWDTSAWGENPADFGRK
jgi:ribonuclease HI